MQRALQLLGLVVALGAALFWLARGAHRGWTQTKVPVRTLDEVTGIEGIQYQPKFVPGIDFLAAMLVGAGVLEVSSLFLKRKPINT